MKLMNKIRKMRNEDRTVAEEAYYEKRLFFIDVPPVGFFVEASFAEMEDYELEIYKWLYEIPCMTFADLCCTMDACHNWHPKYSSRTDQYCKMACPKRNMYSQEIGWADTSYIKNGFFDIWETRTCECQEDGNSLECLVLRPINPNCCCVDDKYYQFKGGLHIQ